MAQEGPQAKQMVLPIKTFQLSNNFFGTQNLGHKKIGFYKGYKNRSMKGTFIISSILMYNILFLVGLIFFDEEFSGGGRNGCRSPIQNEFFWGLVDFTTSLPLPLILTCFFFSLCGGL